MRHTSLKFPFVSALLAATALLLSACGGSGGGDNDTTGERNETGSGTNYTGSESAATVTADNQQEIAFTSREGTERVIEQSEAGGSSFPTGVEVQDLNELVNTLTLNLLEAGQLPTAVTQTVEGDCGGNAVVESDDEGESGSIEYNNFCVSSEGETVVMDGRVEFSFTETLYIMDYQDITLTYDGITQELDMEVRCEVSGETFDCTYNSDFTGSDGRTYRSSNAEVTGSASTGYNVSARIYDPDHGYIDIEANNIVVCDGGGISSGSISVSDNSGSVVMTVEFSSCDTMTVTYDGSAEIYDQ